MPLALLAAAWLAGIVLTSAFGFVHWPAAAALAVLAPAAAILARRWTALALLLLAASALLLGSMLYHRTVPAAPETLAGISEGSPIRLTGVVDGEPDHTGQFQRVRLSVHSVDGGDSHPTGARVLAYAPLYPRLAYGDELTVSGVLERPPVLPGFDYRDYLARQGTDWTIPFATVERTATGRANDALEAIHALRAGIGDALDRALPEPHAALARGMLLGQRSALPPDLVADLNDTNTSHLIAISGFNVTLIASLVIGALAWLVGRRNACLAALALVAFYTLLTGASPSVVRAAIMGGIFILASLVGRPGSALTAILLAAALMTAWQPLAIDDVGFQLSFAVVAGIAYLASPMRKRLDAFFSGDAEPLTGLPAALTETAATTAAAVIATLPIIAVNFERVSLVGFAANVLLVPAFPAIFLLSAATALAGLIAAPLGQAVGWLAWPALVYMIEVARLLADVPFAALRITGVESAHAALFYATLGAAVWIISRRNRPALPAPLSRAVAAASRPLRAVPAVWLVGLLALACALAWYAVLTRPDPRLTVTVLDVGQGDAIFIETPGGHQILVDGGPSGETALNALASELPFWDRSLDLLVLTHPQEDHLAGLVAVLDRYSVRQVLAPNVPCETALCGEWTRLISEKRIALLPAISGSEADLGRGARMQVLAPIGDPSSVDDPNEASVVLRLSWGDLSWLLTGDLTATGETALLASRQDLHATVLKVAHHGSATSTSIPFLEAVRPAIAVISAGEGNRFGHPAPVTLEKLPNALVFRTDLNGRVRFTTDSRRLWVQTGRR